MWRTTPLISRKQHSGPKILAPLAETRRSEIHRICAQESPFCPSPICINLDTDQHFLCLHPQAQLHLASHHIASRHTIPDSTAIAAHQSISHSQQRNEKKKDRTEQRISENYHCGAIRMRRVRNQVRIGRRFLLEKLPEQENRTRADSIVPRHGCNRRRFQSHSRQNTMQLDRIHKPRRAENLHIEKKQKDKTDVHRPSLCSSCVIFLFSALSRTLFYLYLSLSLRLRPSVFTLAGFHFST
jgi:hypothetical protein